MISLIKTLILNYTRRRKTILFNIFFPVFLIIILGFTLAKNFDSGDDYNQEDIIEVLYIDEGNEYTKKVLEAFKNIDSEIEIKLTEDISIEAAKQKVRVQNKVFIYLNQDKIEFYSNDNFLMDSSVVYSIVKGITNGLNATIEIYKVNPEGALMTTAINEDEILNIEAISSDKSPSAMDYYGVAELGLMMFYYFSTPIFFMKDEKKRNIKDRILLSGISNRQYYFASFIAYSIVSFACTTFAYLIAKFALGVNYGTNILILPLAAIPFITLVISLGIFLCLVLKDEERGEAIGCSVVIPALCFLGGGYIAIGDNVNKVFNIFTQISPLRWFNNGLLRYIYNGDSSMLIKWIIIGSIATLILLGLIYYLVGREELLDEKCMDSI